MPSRRSATALAVGAAAACSLAFTGSALGAGVSLADPSPASGAKVQTTSKGATIPLAWTTDTTGCRPGTTAFLRINKESPDSQAFLIQNPISLPLSGVATLSRSTPVKKDAVVTWSITLRCINEVLGQPSIEVTSEVRTFTLVRPDPRPKAIGRYRTFLGGKIKNAGRPRSTLTGQTLWSFKPLRAKGPSNVRVNIRKVGNVTLRYNARKRLWTGKLTGAKLGRLFFCRRTGSSARIRKAVKGSLTIKLRAKANRSRVVGDQTHALQLAGTLKGKLIPNARGKARGCPSARVNGTIKAFRL